MSNQIKPDILHNEQFPRSNKYDPGWIFDNQMGPNPLWLTEFLVETFDLKPGMRVLDLGSGKGITEIFKMDNGEYMGQIRLVATKK